MSYVDDMVLNFNNDLYEFYEWKKDDTIYHIKKICVIKTDSKTYNDIFDNIVIFNDNFLLSIFNKCEYYDNRNIESIPYAFLLTDSYRVMGICLNHEGKIIKYSSLLLDEEEYVLNLCDKLVDTKFDYHIVKKRYKCEFKTRLERYIIKYIKRDLNDAYHKKNINKLRYLYYEYFNKENDNIEIIYQELIRELEKDLDERHYNLYNLIKLSYSGKTV